MAVTDDLDRSVQGGEFDRQPPQDLAAEQSVLGGMLLSKDAIADVIESVHGTDFYRPAHQVIFDTITDLYGRGEPADPVTVSSALTKSGELLRIGGAPYLHTLINAVPTAANAGYYAEIVAERAVLRRLVEAGTRIVQLGYGAAQGRGGEIEQIVDRAQAEVYDVTERRMSEDYVILEHLLQGTMDEIDAIAQSGGRSTGVMTGFEELDEKTHGLHPGQLILIAARPALGKALALDTPLATPNGWTTMGGVRVGDQLLGADGRPTTVVAATDVLTDRPIYEVEFSDGSVIVADAEHLWRTTTRAARRAAGERQKPSYDWSEPARRRVRDLARTAAAAGDQLVATQEVSDEVGPEFASILPAVARELRRRLAAAGQGSGDGRRPGGRRLPRAALLVALEQRVNRPCGSGQAASPAPIVTTREIAQTLRCSSADGRPNHAVDNAAPLQLLEAELPVPPYTFGAWLGDGHSAAARLTTEDPEIVESIRGEGVCVTGGRHPLNFSLRLPAVPVETRGCDVCGRSFRPATTQVRTCGKSCGGKVRGVTPARPVPTCPECSGYSSTGRTCLPCRRSAGSVQARLRTLGVLGDKHIPGQYLRASEAQRRALLAGLLDTDGYVNRDGNVELVLTNERLSADARELIVSLGYRVSVTTKRVRGRREATSTAYRLHFTPREPVFRLRRKLARQSTPGPRVGRRDIVDVRPAPSVPVRCVQVDNGDSMYLAGSSMIPTHNSTLALDIARAASIKQGLTTCIFSLEMSKSEITMRLLSAEARVPLHHMRSGHMNDEDWTKLGRRMGEVADAPLFIDDSPNLTMMEIRAKARRLKQRHGLRLVVVDYLQLMTSGRKVESRQQEVSEFSRALKLLAKELEVPVIALSQLNRGPEQRTDKKPMLSDLRESGSLEQDADVVILIHREDFYEPESPRAGEADLLLVKHRNGPTGTVAVSFQGHFSKFDNMPQR